jgi:hypothetical protein
MASADPTERSEVVDEDKLGRERPDVPERDRREVGELVDPATVETTPPDGRAEAIEGELVDEDQLAPDDGPEQAAVHEMTDPASYPDD